MTFAHLIHRGARHVVITDINDYRLGLAKSMGASRALNISRESLDQAMQDLGMEEGLDVGFEMSGNPAALRELLRTIRKHYGICWRNRHFDRLRSCNCDG